MTKKVLGIDFGTTYTYISQYDGQVYKNVGMEFAKDTAHAQESIVKKSPGIPTLIGVKIDANTNEEKWMVGEELRVILDQQDAIIKNVEVCIMGSVQYNGEEIYYCDNLKQLLRERPLPSDENEDWALFYGQNNDRSITIIDLAKKFFETIIAENIYRESNSIAIGVPGKDTNSGNLENYKTRIQQIFKEEEKKLFIVEEPVAAAIAYCKYNNMPAGNFLVIDIGGGTSDFSIICKEQIFSLKDADGNKQPAGNNLDEDITGLIERNASKNLQIEVTKAKEKLFSSDGGEGMADFNYNNLKRELSLKRNYTSEEEQVVNISPTLNIFANRISDNIKKWKEKNEDNFIGLEGILYVGGTSNIEYLRETIKSLLSLSEINEYCFAEQKVLDVGLGKDKKIELTYANAVAVGAALYAFNLISRSTKEYRIKSAYKLELKLPEKTGKTVDWKVKATLLDKDMIFDGNIDSKGPCLIKTTSQTSTIIDFKIVKEGREYPEGDKGYNVNTFGKDICIFADWNEKKQEPIIYVCATDALDSGYQYVCDLNNGDQLLISSKEQGKTGSSKDVDWCYKCIPGKDDSMSCDRISAQIEKSGWGKR